MDKIREIRLVGYAREESLSAKEAVLWCLRKDRLQPRTVLDLLCDRFQPPYRQTEVKTAFCELMNDDLLILTADRYLEMAP